MGSPTGLGRGGTDPAMALSHEEVPRNLAMAGRTRIEDIGAESIVMSL